MSEPELLLITGKGGTGKTTAAAALGLCLSQQGQRVLIVELVADRSIAGLFRVDHLDRTPVHLAPRLSAIRVDSRALLEDYFRRLLRIPTLTRRLLSSGTFRAITAAAPGVTEFLILDHVLQWLGRDRRRRRTYDVVLVDGPATGHAIELLRTPRQLAAMVPSGPIASSVSKLQAVLDNPRRTQVLLTTVADEMAVNEAVHAQSVLSGELGLQVTRPVLNRVVPRRFTSSERQMIRDVSTHDRDDQLLAAARLHVSLRSEADRQVRRLRRTFGVPPIMLPQVWHDGLQHRDLARLGRTLNRGLFGTQTGRGKKTGGGRITRLAVKRGTGP